MPRSLSVALVCAASACGCTSLDRAAGVGGEVEVAQGGRRLRGRFLDIDARARLRLATDSGEITIEAGDVFLPARGQD